MLSTRISFTSLGPHVVKHQGRGPQWTIYCEQPYWLRSHKEAVSARLAGDLVSSKIWDQVNQSLKLLPFKRPNDHCSFLPTALLYRKDILRCCPFVTDWLSFQWTWYHPPSQWTCTASVGVVLSSISMYTEAPLVMPRIYAPHEYGVKRVKFSQVAEGCEAKAIDFDLIVLAGDLLKCTPTNSSPTFPEIVWC